jgi:hypothetical protein
MTIIAECELSEQFPALACPHERLVQKIFNWQIVAGMVKRSGGEIASPHNQKKLKLSWQLSILGIPIS